ncbi:MAG: hypothetical protein JRJ19_04545 [Deltaproteobacteria bacterium]|nr:hypothetical protein [Deltaproteobacteria bacterium]
MKKYPFGLIALCFLVFACNAESDKSDAGLDGDAGNNKWEPPEVHLDQAYIQEVGLVVGQLDDVNAVGLDSSDTCHVALADGVRKWDGNTWLPVTLAISGQISDLAFNDSGTLAVVGPQGAEIGGQVVDLPVGALASFVAPRAAGGWWLAGENLAGYWDTSFHSIFESINQPVGAICDLPDGTWFAATPQGVFSSAGLITSAEGLPSNLVTALTLGPGSTIWVGTDAGLAKRDSASSVWTAFVGADGLHYGDVLDIDFDGSGNLLVATSKGASVYYADGSRRYYFGINWIPHENVRGLARAADGTIWLATAAGVSKIEQRSMTLASKAAVFDQVTQARHLRLGYTTTANVLREYGDLTTFYNRDDDNDGQWTAMYLASQCFRYAVTDEAEARENARVAAYALMKLEEVTPIEGFFARSIVAGDECEAMQQAGGEWHLTADEVWCWKGDTSSDEFVGHIFGLSLYYDLVADQEQQQDVAATIGRIVGYIIDNDYKLLDIDGEPTTHGFFNPEWMEENPSAMFGDAGLNSAMILGALHAAYRMTGQERFRESFEYLVHDRNYKDYISCIEETNLKWHTNHDSEEMSFLAMYTLMRYEDDPALLELWRNGNPQLECQGLEYLWEVQRPERNPEFNMIYAPLARKEVYDLSDSIETLQKLPLNLIHWGLDHGHRWDKDQNPYNDRQGRPQNKFVFAYDERQVMRWAENPYSYEQRGNGHSESSGTFWLLPYWMARYYGIID